MHILKTGGRLIDDDKALTETIQFFISLPGKKIWVHGGGNYANKLCEQMGVQPLMRDGRRITDAQTLEIVTMVYAGLLNKKIVSLLQAEGCNAIGLSGADGNCIRAEKRPAEPFDYGFAGDIQNVNLKFFDYLTKEELLPVVCSITHDQKGQLLNTNADTIASTLAAAFSEKQETKLLLLMDKPGILENPKDDESVVIELDGNRFREMKANGTISQGMIPKLDNAFRVLNEQLKIQIGNIESIKSGICTKLLLGNA